MGGLPDEVDESANKQRKISRKIDKRCTGTTATKVIQQVKGKEEVQKEAGSIVLQRIVSQQTASLFLKDRCYN